MGEVQSQWTSALLMAKAIERLTSRNIGDARRNVEWIFCELLKCNRATLYANPELIITPEIAAKMEALLTRRLAHEPLQYILGYTEFCGLRINVTPDVLIPRPETELLIELANDCLKDQNNPVILDIGSGSGCIPIAIKHFNAHAQVYSCDISEPALEVARANAAYHKTPVTFFRSDILTSLSLSDSQMFDLIVSNPPYIPTREYRTLDKEVLDFEPAAALDSGDDPLSFYKAISTVASQRLRKGGDLLLETHTDYAHNVASLLSQNGFHNVQVLKDLAMRDRFVKANWHFSIDQ